MIDMKRTSVRIVVVGFILLCTAGTLVAQDDLYPVLMLDMSNSSAEDRTEPGFTSFTIADSGSEYEGITVGIAPLTGSIDARWRDVPTGIPYELIYRDFIFSRPGGMQITLSGLEADTAYGITIFAYDQYSTSDRIADWTANGEYLLTTAFAGGSAPQDEDDNAFSGTAQSDAAGVIVLECGPGEGTVEESGANNPYGFVNALIVSSLTPVTKARKPIPPDRSIVNTTAVELQWESGMTSASSNVYFGEDFDVVNDAATDSEVFRGSTEGNVFTVGSEGNPYPGGLVERTTYYWRIDEVEAGGTVYQGDVWRFTVAPKQAFNPGPVDGTLFIDPNVTLIWDPGAGSVEHHVYFGTGLEDVQTGTGGTDQGVQETNTFAPGLLDLETTYYWRVDEFDGTDTIVGEVWSFTTTLEGLGTVIFDFWEGLTGSTLADLEDDGRYPDNPTSSEPLTEFATADSIGDNYGARIHGWLYVPMTGDYTFWFTSADQGQLWLSTDDQPENVQLLAEEPVWGSYDTFSHKSTPIPLVGGQKYYIQAVWKEGTDWDHCQVAWEGAGIREMEIIQGSFLSPYVSLTASGPYPGNGSTDVPVNQVLRWRPSDYAESHVVNLGTSPEALVAVGTLPLGEEAYAASLDPNTTYYWRVDEVQAGHPDSPWIGKLWSFTTGYGSVIDDFEGYNDEDNLIFDAWVDGYVNGTGSQVGNLDPPYAGQLVVRSGRQAMPFTFDNFIQPYYSEASRQWAPAQDWTADGATTLTLWVRGVADNPAEPLYAGVEDSGGTLQIVVNPDEAATQTAAWTQWDIPLSDLSGAGVNLGAVSVMYIGVGDRAAPVRGLGGTLHFDDFRLHRP